MSIFDKFRGKKTKKEAAQKADENIYQEPKKTSSVATIFATKEGGILLVPVIFPANASEFPGYLIPKTVQIIEKGYPFIKVVPQSSNITPLLELQQGYNLARDQYEVEVVLNWLDSLAKSTGSFKFLAIMNEDLYSSRDPRSPQIYGMAGKYGVVVSIFPLNYKIWDFMNPVYDEKLKRFAKEFQINTDGLSRKDLYRIYWLAVVIFHELGHAFGLSHAENREDIMYPPFFVHEVLERGYKMPESGPLLNDILRKLNLKIIDKSSPLVATQENPVKPID
ncbi:MAG TPA: matrixin family metalloprotease [Candidatus Bathyarchaeia archaeon]|nr:matrixin family metalloprotease [Candidatus Bathyarchaeia archaeon]